MMRCLLARRSKEIVNDTAMGRRMHERTYLDRDPLTNFTQAEPETRQCDMQERKDRY